MSDASITWILDAYLKGEVAEEQMSALLMAIFFNGMNSKELGVWTDQMISSGERLNLKGLSRPTVDKHSTGGVGDKISLILAPLVAACGAAVPQPVSEVCDKHGLNPTAFYRWQKEFFENGAAAFESRQPRSDGKTRQLEQRVEALQAKLVRKDEVIGELMEDHVRLKKSLGES